MKRDALTVVEDVVKVVAVVMIMAPFLPEPRVAWFCAMRACQNVSRHFGLLAIAAENRYRREVP